MPTYTDSLRLERVDATPAPPLRMRESPPLPSPHSQNLIVKSFKAPRTRLRHLGPSFHQSSVEDADDGARSALATKSWLVQSVRRRWRYKVSYHSSLSSIASSILILLITQNLPTSCRCGGTPKTRRRSRLARGRASRARSGAHEIE